MCRATQLANQYLDHMFARLNNATQGGGRHRPCLALLAGVDTTLGLHSNDNEERTDFYRAVAAYIGTLAQKGRPIGPPQNVMKGCRRYLAQRTVGLLAPLSPDWLTSDVRALAAGIWEQKAYDRTPILADALQDAGCGDDYRLDHLRHGTHDDWCAVVQELHFHGQPRTEPDPERDGRPGEHMGVPCVVVPLPEHDLRYTVPSNGNPASVWLAKLIDKPLLTFPKARRGLTARNARGLLLRSDRDSEWISHIGWSEIVTRLWKKRAESKIFRTPRHQRGSAGQRPKETEVRRTGAWLLRETKAYPWDEPPVWNHYTEAELFGGGYVDPVQSNRPRMWHLLGQLLTAHEPNHCQHCGRSDH